MCIVEWHRSGLLLRTINMISGHSCSPPWSIPPIIDVSSTLFCLPHPMHSHANSVSEHVVSIIAAIELYLLMVLRFYLDYLSTRKVEERLNRATQLFVKQALITEVSKKIVNTVD